jgi:DNA-binding NtrC family response regulator
VDDEQNIADSLVMILNSRGCSAWAAYSAEEAMRIAAELRPQAVISDVVMPGMNGLEFTFWLADNHPECKVLLISGNIATAGLLEESLNRGHAPKIILPKPVAPEKILQFVSTCATAA